MIRKPKHLEDRLFAFLWNRHVESRSVDECQEAADISLDDVIAHRSRRTRPYVAAETRMNEMLPRQMLVAMARAAQARVLNGGSESTAASVAKTVLDADDEADDRPATITFVIEDASPEPRPDPELDCEPDLGREPEPEKPRAYRCYVRPMGDRSAASHERVVLNLPIQPAQTPLVAAKSLRKRDE